MKPSTTPPPPSTAASPRSRRSAASPRAPLSGLLPLLFLALLFLALLCPTALRADTVVLDNGDRLTGQVLGLEGATLTVSTAWGGELSVDWGAVVSIDTEEVLYVELVDGRSLEASLSTGEDGQVRLVAGDADAPDGDQARPLTVARTDLAFMAPSEPPDFQVAGSLKAGLVIAEGNTESDSLYLEGALQVQDENDRFDLEANAVSTEADGRTSAENRRAAISYDRFLTERWFFTARVQGERDELADLRLRSQGSAGIGYQALETVHTALALEAAASYVDEEYFTADDRDFPAARLGLDFRHRLRPGIRLFQRSQVLVNLDDTDDLLFQTKSGVDFTLTDGFVASVQLNLDYDEEPAEGQRSEDRLYLLTLGYSW